MYIKRFTLGLPLHVCQFTMSYPRCIILLNPITQQMFLYVIEYFSSLVQTVYTKTEIFCVLIRSISFGGEFQELFHPFLICKAHLICVHLTSIHLINNSVILTKFFDAWKSHFFIKDLALYIVFRKTFFILDSYIKVKSLFLKLMKFWQHFTLISNYTTWKRWDQFPDNQVRTQSTTRNALYQNFIKFNKRDLTYMYESTIKKWVFPNCLNG